MDWKRFSMTGFKNKRPITRMYATMIALLVIVSLTGFIDRGKSVTLVADGETRQVYTHAVNEKALMRENNIDIGDYDEIDVSTQKLDDGSYVKVRRAIPVTLEYRGQTQEVYTAKHNSQEVAEQYGYNKEKYRPYGDVQKPLQAGQHIVIGHVSRKTITEATGISQPTLHSYIRDRSRMLGASYKTLVKLAECYDEIVKEVRAVVK